MAARSDGYPIGLPLNPSTKFSVCHLYRMAARLDGYPIGLPLDWGSQSSKLKDKCECLLIEWLSNRVAIRSGCRSIGRSLFRSPFCKISMFLD
ncbi:hypothetical protein Hanom_Chr03g00236211 [Helianthus anomalus]